MRGWQLPFEPLCSSDSAAHGRPSEGSICVGEKGVSGRPQNNDASPVRSHRGVEEKRHMG